MSVAEIIQIITAVIGSLGFAVLFNVRGIKLVAATVGGGLSWGLFLLLSHTELGEAVCYFIVSMIVSLYAEIMARALKSPTTIFITPAVIPLVPGASLYYTMSSAFKGDFESFLQKAIDTFILAAAIAVGVIASAVVIKLAFNAAQRIHARINGEKLDN